MVGTAIQKRHVRLSGALSANTEYREWMMIDYKQFKDNILRINEQERYTFDAGLIPSWFRKAAVLVLFFEEDGITRVVLTERSQQVKSHRGEICFPGGKVEPNETLVQAALRETEEEIGISRNRVRIIGRLDDGWSKAAFHMIPFVGWYNGIPDVTPNADEVSSILFPDIRHLCDKSNYSERTVEIQGIPFTNTVIQCQGKQIFGQTADILLEALERGSGVNCLRGRERAEKLQTALKVRMFSYQQNQDDSPACST